MKLNILAVSVVVMVVLSCIFAYFYFEPFKTKVIVLPPAYTVSDITRKPQEARMSQLKEGGTTLPIFNINMRDDRVSGYESMGFITSGETRLPLFGRQKYRGSGTYEYYTRDDSRNGISIPITVKNNKELYSDDKINVKSFEGEFNVEIYDIEQIKYIPF